MTTTDYYLAWNGAANGTITLPAATIAAPTQGNIQGRVYNIKNTSTSSNLTVAANGAELLDNQSGAGVPNIVLPAGYYAMLISKGTITGTTWEVAITGNSNAGCVPGYIIAEKTTVQTVTNGTNIVFNSSLNANNVSLNTATGVFTLVPGNTYELEGAIRGASYSLPTGFIIYSWVDAVTNTPLTTTRGLAESLTSTIQETSQPVSKAIFTATATSNTVALRVSLVNGATSVDGQLNYVTIKQINPCGGSGGSNVGADNGLTVGYNSTGNIGLGGTLAKATDVATAGNNLTFSGTGNVGIGTAAPVFKLHTVGGFSANERNAGDPSGSFYFTRKSRGTNAAPTVVLNGDVTGGMLMTGYTGTVANLYAGYSEISAVATENQTPTAGGNDLRFNTTPNGTTTSAIRMTIANNGNVGIGAAVPGQRLQVVDAVNNNYVASFLNTLNSTNSVGMYIQAGSNNPANLNTALIDFSRAGDGASIGRILQNTVSTVSYITSSDRRLKENITLSKNGLSTILKLQVRDYNYIGDPTLSTGLIAQDAYKVVPSVVHVGSEDVKKNPWGIDYGKLTPYLIQAVQEQQTQIEALKAQNATKDAQIAALQAQATASVSRTEYNELKAMVAQLLAQKNTSVTTVTTDEKK